MQKVDQPLIQIKTRFSLENHLLLAQFIANKLGLRQVSDIKQFSEINEGFSEDGRSYMFYSLISKKGNTIPEGKLRQYDDNIRKHFQKLKRNREERISFKYYQYLALLFSEIYLDNYFQNPVKFLNELNQWAEQTKSDNYFSRRPDLQKIAYWMATGSGKTLIMHANYWQILAYNKGPNKIDYENIILITTGDEMSKQHLDELKASGIPGTLFQWESGGYFEADKNIVKVISIHKLKLPEDKKGEGVTIDISALGTRNLVFVDEGHKGQKSEDMKWKKTRERLAKDGFTFEYSATFGQAIDSSNEESFKEYSKAILFDYSYKYFYGDGYGKDFRILNIGKKEFNEKQTITLLLANAVAFYEQIVQYRNEGNSLKEYNIEKPLWIFVGSKVQKESGDVFKVVQFLNWLLNENKNRIKELIDGILRGQSGIISDNKDVFAPRHPERNFTYFREKKTSAEEIYNGIFTDIFHVSPENMGRKLHLIDLKEAEGEIGLRAGTSQKYFAVINIGDKREFLNLIEEAAKDVNVERAAISKSLFEKINEPDSTINLLIGSKKFIEGWNSWRVSTMSLLYIGKGAGAQIIQLFGRGVRLKGKDLGLKRTRFVQPPHPQFIEILETLHIFGIQANYMETFKEIIEKEDVPTYEIPLPTKKIEPFPEDLQIIGLKYGWSFEQELFKLEPKDDLEIKLDLVPRAQIIDGRGDQTLTSTAIQTTQIIRREILDILDWNDIYYRILEYKNERGLFNIAIRKEALKEIIYNKKYKLLCDAELIEPKSFEDMEKATDVIILLLKKYFNMYYSKKRNAAEKTHIELKPLKKEDENILALYRIQLNEEDQVLINNIENLIITGKIYSSSTEQKLLADLKTYIDKNPTTFKNAHFKGHLYQPLLIKQDNSNIITIPTGLNTGESTFVEDLKNYLNSHSIDVEIYLLRNLTRSKGVGFYETHSFYPDFIMWIKKAQKQTVVFIDPKGLTHMGVDDPKLKLHEYLGEQIENEIGNPNIKLDAYVISVTPFRDLARLYGQHLTREYFEQDKHVLFQSTDAGIPNTSYIDKMFEIIFASK
jgi:hypothetical protein